ncbi:MAG: EamA family transporter [Proteobacteria bacterium]|nr:MAG: EamA family transporter [Pseudomonadota bacterium]QKK11559.1 MAG: EamA family transporter [Pseudomonadota bacterium]
MTTGLWHRHSGLAYLAVFVGVLGHASSEFVSVLSGVAGPELSVWRFLLGGAGLVILALIIPGSRDLLTPLKTHGVRLVALSILGVTFAYLFFHWSLDFASVVQVATLVTTIPIFVGVSNLLINRAPMPMAKILSGFCALLGIALLITDGYLLQLAGSAENLTGILMAITCAAAVAAYSVLVKPIITQYGALRITAITMFIGAIGLWLVVGVFFGIWVAPQRLTGLDQQALTALAALAIFNTTITQFLWIGGLAAVPDITRGSYLFFLKPVIAALLAVSILDQSLTLTQLIAIVVITASVFSEMLVGQMKK